MDRPERLTCDKAATDAEELDEKNSKTLQLIWNKPHSLGVGLAAIQAAVTAERGCGMFKTKSVIFAAAAAACLAAPGAQAFDGGGATADLMRGTAQSGVQAQKANLPTELNREVAPTRTLVPDPTEEKPGTITVDTKNRYLYLSLEGGQAMRYDVGVGREGFGWQGRAYIGRRAEWPAWTPPADMLKRRPELPKIMAGGIKNPLGARAMYLYDGHGDTMYRIHGTNEPDTIGQAVSSGCIRVLNDDIIDLYRRVKVGATVVVL